MKFQLSYLLPPHSLQSISNYNTKALCYRFSKYDKSRFSASSVPDVNNFSFIYSQVCNDMIQNLLATPQMTRILLKIFFFFFLNIRNFSPKRKLFQPCTQGLFLIFDTRGLTWCAKLCDKTTYVEPLHVDPRAHKFERPICLSAVVVFHYCASSSAKRAQYIQIWKSSVAYWVTCVNGLLRLITKYGVKGSQNILPVSEGLYLGGPIRSW